MDEKILNILTETRPEFDFTEDVDYMQHGMFDSFDIVSLVTSFDEEFGISIDGEDIVPENFSSFKNIKQLLIKNGAKE